MNNCRPVPCPIVMWLGVHMYFPLGGYTHCPASKRYTNWSDQSLFVWCNEEAFTCVYEVGAVGLAGLVGTPWSTPFVERLLCLG